MQGRQLKAGFLHSTYVWQWKWMITYVSLKFLHQRLFLKRRECLLKRTALSCNVVVFSTSNAKRSPLSNTFSILSIITLRTFRYVRAWSPPHAWPIKWMNLVLLIFNYQIIGSSALSRMIDWISLNKKNVVFLLCFHHSLIRHKMIEKYIKIKKKISSIKFGIPSYELTWVISPFKRFNVSAFASFE